MQIPHTLVITGASSGLGAALAKAYARPGITLGLTGRNAQRLQEIASFCTQRGAIVKVGVLDVCDGPAMSRWLEAFDREHPIDLVVANAGISAGTGGQGESEEQVRRIFATNINGVLNTVMPAIPLMQSRKRGQIAIISSLAGLRGLPSCPAYSASKMAIRGFGEGLRGILKKDGIAVSVICPGYIKTPLTEVNKFPMPFIMSAERAALIIMRGLARNRSRIAFPGVLYWPLWLLCCLPNALTDAFFAALPGKTAMEKV